MVPLNGSTHPIKISKEFWSEILKNSDAICFRLEEEPLLILIFKFSCRNYGRRRKWHQNSSRIPSRNQKFRSLFIEEVLYFSICKTISIHKNSYVYPYELEKSLLLFNIWQLRTCLHLKLPNFTFSSKKSKESVFELFVEYQIDSEIDAGIENH